MFGGETEMFILPYAGTMMSQLDIGPCPRRLVWSSVSSNPWWQEVLFTTSRLLVAIHVVVLIV
jgi:hypothetical protein